MKSDGAPLLPPPGSDARLEEFASGQRVLLAPPGLAAFVAVQMLLLVGAASCAVPSMAKLLPGLQAGTAPLLAVLAVLPTVVIPGLLVAHGLPSGQACVQRAIAAWLVLSLAAGAVGTIDGRPIAVAAAGVALALLLTAVALARGTPYRAYAEFMRQVRSRRRRIA